MRNRLLMVLLCSALIGSGGCTVVSTVREMTASTVQALRPESGNGWDPGSESTDPWVQEAGAQARGNREMEKEADPLNLKRFFMSDKARDIERNLGVE
jgi:hypothetical protein